MTNAEMIQKIVNRSGVTPQQAEEALRLNNWDLLDAMIYVEKTYGSQNNANASRYSTYNYSSFNSDGNGFTDFNEKKSGFDGRSFGGVAGDIFRKVLDNGIAISHNGREIFNIPLLFWIIFLFSSFSGLLWVMFITMFFNVSYRFTGKNLGGSRLNKVFDAVYGFVQKIKRDLAG